MTDILLLKVGISFEDIFSGMSARYQADDGSYSYAQASNARAAPHDCRVKRNPVKLDPMNPSFGDYHQRRGSGGNHRPRR